MTDRSAAVIIVVFLDISDSYNRDKDIMAVGACIQNMLLQTHSLKLGGCWLGEILNKREEVEKFLTLDKDLELLAVVALGLPAKTKRPVKTCRESLKSLLVRHRCPHTK